MHAAASAFRCATAAPRWTRPASAWRNSACAPCAVPIWGHDVAQRELPPIERPAVSRELAVALFVPPVALVFAALLGLLLEWRHQRLGRLLAWAATLGLLLLAMPPIANTLLFLLERNLPLAPPPDAPPQAIVVLGGDNLP